MIDWLIDRWWAWKNREWLRHLDEQTSYLRTESERLDRRMVEAFGSGWREQAERRLERIAGLYPPRVDVGIDRSPSTWWTNRAGGAQNP